MKKGQSNNTLDVEESITWKNVLQSGVVHEGFLEEVVTELSSEYTELAKETQGIKITQPERRAKYDSEI